MSISDKRFSKTINTILREELQKGNLPSSKEFIWKVNQYLQDHSLTGASFEFTNVQNSSTARAIDYNNTMSTVYNDLETLYINIIEQNNFLIKNFNKFDIDKSKLDYQLNVLENQLKELILLYNQDGFLRSVYDVFNDFSYVDSTQTTAHVDIVKHQVMIDSVKNASRKINPQSVISFNVLPEISNIVTTQTISGLPEDAMNNKTNSTWQQMILAKDKINVGGYYSVLFTDSAQYINKIGLSLHSVKPIFIKIEFTNDNITWLPLPYYEGGVTIQNEYSFDFPTINAASIRILMAKSEPDNEVILQDSSVATSTSTSLLTQINSSESQSDVYSRRYRPIKDTTVETIQSTNLSDKIRYGYVFGIKQLTLFTASYSNSATLYSQPLVVTSDTNFTIDKVSILVNEEVPNGTDILYYVALPAEGTNALDWKPISPVNRTTPKFDQVIDFKNVTTSIPNLFSIDPAISIGEYEIESLRTNGIRFYSIGEITDRQIIDGTEKLYMGKDTWGNQFYTYQQADNTAHLPSVDDWIKPANQVTASYVNIQDGKPGLLLNKQTTSTGTNFMFTIGIFSQKDKQLMQSIPVSTDPIAIYMNGQLLFQGIPNTTTKVSYLFQTGWNEINVFVYTRESVGTQNGCTVDVNFDPRQYGSHVYAQAQPMKKVSIFDLRYNVLNTNAMSYAIQQVNNKSQIIINNANPGLQYEFYYNYVDGTAKKTILFKSEFVKDDSITEASAKLKSYRLRFS